MEDKFSQDSDSVESVHSDTNSNFSDEIHDGFIFDNDMKKLVCTNVDSQTIPVEVLDQYAERTKVKRRNDHLFFFSSNNLIVFNRF